MNKIRVPTYHGSIKHLKELFAKYPHSSPSIEEIKEACLKDGRPKETVNRMKKPNMKQIIFKGRKVEVIEEKVIRDSPEDHFEAIIEEPENEPLEIFEGFDMESEGFDMEESESEEEQEY